MEGKDIEIAGRTPNLLGYAAKLPRYQRGVERSNKRKPEHKEEDLTLFPLEYPGGSLPQHGDRVWVRFNEFGEDTIRKSVITRIRPYESNSPPPGDGTWYKGWVFVSNENILSKKYERVFIEQEQDKEIEVTPEIAAPEKLLAANLHPATKLEELSPAERVFGWVKTNPGKGERSAYKGNLRIGLVKCQKDDAIAKLGDNGFPLAILGQPQPQQARFYVANNKQGKPLETRQNNNRTQKPGYDNLDGGLRGRKVYPHHRLPDGHWNLPQTE